MQSLIVHTAQHTGTFRYIQVHTGTYRYIYRHTYPINSSDSFNELTNITQRLNLTELQNLRTIICSPRVYQILMRQKIENTLSTALSMLRLTSKGDIIL